MRSIYEILNIPEDATHSEVEKLYNEYLEKYNPKRYENSHLKPIAIAKYNELVEAYSEYLEKRKLEQPLVNNPSVDNSEFLGQHVLRGYRPGYYRRSNGCCDDVCRCIGCMWVGDTCCECMCGDCISCM